MPITQSVNSKANVKKSTNQDLPFAPQQPVINSFYAVSTAGQTVINLTFSVDTVNLTDQFFLFVDGKKLTLGSSNDYTFTAIGSNGYSSQVTLTQSLAINLNIQAYQLGLKKESEFAMDNRFVQLYAAQGSGFQGFVSQTDFLMTATSTAGTPAAGTFYSSIIGRAPIVDLSQNLKAQMGVERMMIENIFLSPTEFGPLGQPVWVTSNDIFSQVRLAGTGWSAQGGNAGFYPYTATANDYVEITFYGTGLNLLDQVDGGVRSYNISVDGGATTSNALTGFGILNNRNYAMNIVRNMVSGLALGIHTVTITNIGAGGLSVYGFEILNESSLVKVSSGVGYVQGQKYTSSALQSFSYSAPVTGARGGRALVYQKGDGTIGQVWQAVNGAQANLASADHTNEEVVRTYFFREFGASRADDLSLAVAGSNVGARAFTLDDGTTTISTSSFFPVNTPSGQPESVGINTTNDFITLTFVGCGLDVYNTQLPSSITAPDSVTIDGTVIGTGTSGSLWKQGWTKIVSGLPYGTHTFKYTKTNTGSGAAFAYFKVYQPKKPSVPSGTIELADYNVMATFVPNTTQGLETLGTGTLLKASTREVLYFGSGWSAAQSSSHATGWRIGTATNGDYLEYTFFGTGFELKTFTGGSDSASVQITLQNLTAGGSLLNLTTANFPTLLGANYGGSFSTSTGVASFAGTSQQMGFSAYNLPLSLYKVRMTNGTSNFFQVSCINPVVPIHSAKSNIYADLQNTLPVGSQGIFDNRKTTPVKEALPAQKAWSQATGIAQNPTTTSTVPLPMNDMSCIIKTNGGAIQVSYNVVSINNTTSGVNFFWIYVDGVQINGGLQVVQFYTVSALTTSANVLIIPVSPGVHKVDIYWAVNGGQTGQLYNNTRTMTVKEL